MEKFYTYTITLIFVLLLLGLLGYPTLTSGMLSFFSMSSPDSASGLTGTPLWVKLTVAFISLIALGVSAVITKTVADLPVSATFAWVFCALFVAEMVKLITYAETSWESWLIFLISAPLTVAYIFSIYDWSRSR